ncbi:MAG: hypothetical protein Q7S73_02685 [bacterium]|nr:hypothetical protein [bacterium]
MQKGNKELAELLKSRIDAVLKDDFKRQKQLCDKMYAPVSGLVHITVLVPDRWLTAISKNVADELERLYKWENTKVRFDLFVIGKEKSICIWFFGKDEAIAFGVRVFGENRVRLLLNSLRGEINLKLKKDEGFSHHVNLKKWDAHNITPLLMDDLAKKFKWKFVRTGISISDSGDAYPKLYLGNKKGLHYFLIY